MEKKSEIALSNKQSEQVNIDSKNNENNENNYTKP